MPNSGAQTLVVVLPEVDADIGSKLRWADAVLLPGGGDLDPSFYGEEPATDTIYDVDRVQDAFDWPSPGGPSTKASLCWPSAEGRKSSTSPAGGPCTKTSVQATAPVPRWPSNRVPGSEDYSVKSLSSFPATIIKAWPS